MEGDSMGRIPCFLLEPTERVRVKLRRFSRNNTPDCCSAYPGKYSYHSASTPLCEEPIERNEEGSIINGLKPIPAHDDPRWPLTCTCGYAFQESDAWQRFDEQLWRRADTGEEMTIAEAPAGAMWEAPWLDRFHVPQGKHNLMVKTPGGDWAIDSQANNCTMPDDHKQEKHHCWIRHGEAPTVTVDKSGVTCGAGVGSIATERYHGFLHNGYLEN
jgi:hypothetical protein